MNVWRRQCEVKSFRPVAPNAASNQQRGLCRENTRPTPRLWFFNPDSIAVTREFIRTCRASPCLLFGIVMTWFLKSTNSQSIPYCSLRRIPVCNATSNSGRRFGQSRRMTLRMAVSSLSLSHRMRALFSFLWWTSRAGFPSGRARTSVLANHITRVTVEMSSWKSFY